MLFFDSTLADLPCGRLLGLDIGKRVGHHGDQQAEQDDGRDVMTS